VAQESTKWTNVVVNVTYVTKVSISVAEVAMYVEDQVRENPKVMLVGDAPDWREVKERRPFVGKSGEQLTKLLNVAEINREECYLTNVINECPPKNDYGVYYRDRQRREPLPSLVDAWGRLREKIQRYRPSVVVVLGEEALRAICGQRGIEKRRGSIYSHSGVSVVPTFHPKMIIRGGGTSHWYTPAAIHDLLRARLVAEGRLIPTEPKYRLITNPREMDTFFEHVSKRSGVCAFDIETTRVGGDMIRCIGFAVDEKYGLVVNFEDPSIPHLEIMHVIRKWMMSGQIKWVGQNAYNFDIPYIRKTWGFELKGYYADTMVMHHVLYPEFPHDLASISSFYSTIPYWKDTSEENLYKYNAFDVCATFSAWSGMDQELEKSGLRDLYYSYYQPLLSPLTHITIQGMKIDKEYQKKLKGDLRAETKTLQKELDEIYTEHTNTAALERRLSRVRKCIEGGRKTVKLPQKKSGKITRKRLSSLEKTIEKEIKKKGSLNVRSTKDLAHFLYSVLGLPKKTKQGRVTTDVTALNQLFIKTRHPFLKTMIKLRHKRNMMSRWGNLKTDENDLIGTTYSFAETGRLKSGKFNAK